jgi:hypothetical protein
MGNRKTRRIVPLAIVLCAGLLQSRCAAADASTQPLLEVGSTAPKDWLQVPGARSSIIWVFGGDDYLGCASIARDLRALQRDNRGTQISLVYVGERPAWAQTWARRQRLKAEFHGFHRRDFLDRFGSVRVPAVYLVQNGRVIQAESAVNVQKVGVKRGTWQESS